MLVDEELLHHEADRWVPAAGLDQVQVPPTISALLSARLDRLSPSEHAVIERAAVIGKCFHRGAVAAMLQKPDRGELDRSLRSLGERNWSSRAFAAGGRRCVPLPPPADP